MPETQCTEKMIKNQIEVLKRIDVYIGTTNTKCTIVMSYCAAAIAFIVTLLAKLEPNDISMQLMVAIGLFSILAFALAIWCMALAIITIFPVTFSKPGTYKGESLIFYGDISSCGGEEAYSIKIKNTSEEGFLDDLNSQVFALATIASNKFSRIQLIATILIIHFACLAATLAGTVIYFIF